MRIRGALAVGAIGLLVAAACGSSDAADDSQPVAAANGAATDDATSAPEPEPTNTTEAEPTIEAAAQDTISFDAEAQPLVSSFSLVEPGSYRVDALGTPFSVTLDEQWAVQPNDPAFFVLTDPSSVGPGDRDVVFLRPTALADPDDPADLSLLEQDDSWDLNDIGGWLDALAGGIDIENRTTTMLGGRTATVWDLRVSDDFPCGPQACAIFVGVDEAGGKSFDPGIAYRVHWVEDPNGPIAIVTGAGRIDDSFLARGQELLSTLAFGESAANPVAPG